MKVLLQWVVLWQGRYALIETKPEHATMSSFVFKAIDEHAFDPVTARPIKVAVKLLRNRSTFLREVPHPSTINTAFHH